MTRNCPACDIETPETHCFICGVDLHHTGELSPIIRHSSAMTWPANGAPEDGPVLRDGEVVLRALRGQAA